MVTVRRFALDNGDGWILDVRRVTSGAPDPALPPVVFVPGYGMNTHILGYHPRGPSMVEYLCRDGFEVWLANLRGQGQSVRRPHGRRRIHLADLALVDVPAVMERVLAETASTAGRAHVVGCSLGGALAYAYLASVVTSHPVASLVSLGGPFRWDDVHPLVAAVARHAEWVGRVPVVGTRALARAAIPLARRVPALLSPYMNARGIDLSKPGELARTVDDPPRGVTRDLAEWIRRGDLVVGGIDVGKALEGIELPILCVLASGDGIVPPRTVTAIRDVAHGPVDVLEVGDAQTPFAHADLFINDQALERVFEPLRAWLKGTGSALQTPEDKGLLAQGARRGGA